MRMTFWAFVVAAEVHRVSQNLLGLTFFFVDNLSGNILARQPLSRFFANSSTIQASWHRSSRKAIPTKTVYRMRAKTAALKVLYSALEVGLSAAG